MPRRLASPTRAALAVASTRAAVMTAYLSNAMTIVYTQVCTAIVDQLLMRVRRGAYHMSFIHHIQFAHYSGELDLFSYKIVTIDTQITFPEAAQRPQSAPFPSFPMKSTHHLQLDAFMEKSHLGQTNISARMQMSCLAVRKTYVITQAEPVSGSVPGWQGAARLALWMHRCLPIQSTTSITFRFQIAVVWNASSFP